MVPRGLLKEHFRLIAFLVQSVDLVLILLAGWAAYFLRFNRTTMPSAYVTALLIGIGVAFILLPLFQLYFSVRSHSMLSYLRRIAEAIGALAIALACLAFFTKSGEHYSRIWFVIWMGNSLIFLTLFRCSLVWLLHLMRSRGWNERRVIIVGASELGERLTVTIQDAVWTGFRVVSFIDDEILKKPNEIRGLPVLKTPEDIGAYLTHEDIDEMWLALPLQAEARVRAMLHDLRHHTVTVRYVLDIFGLDLLNHSVMDLAGFPVLNLRTTPMVGVSRVIKAIEDRVLAGLIFLLISPIFLLITLAV